MDEILNSLKALADNADVHKIAAGTIGAMLLYISGIVARFIAWRKTEAGYVWRNPFRRKPMSPLTYTILRAMDRDLHLMSSDMGVLNISEALRIRTHPFAHDYDVGSVVSGGGIITCLFNRRERRAILRKARRVCEAVRQYHNKGIASTIVARIQKDNCEKIGTGAAAASG